MAEQTEIKNTAIYSSLLRLLFYSSYSSDSVYSSDHLKLNINFTVSQNGMGTIMTCAKRKIKMDMNGMDKRIGFFFRKANIKLSTVMSKKT